MALCLSVCSTDGKDTVKIAHKSNVFLRALLLTLSVCLSVCLCMSLCICLYVCSTDGKDTVKFYTNPMFFFELWCSQIQKEVDKKRPTGKKMRVSDAPDIYSNWKMHWEFSKKPTALLARSAVDSQLSMHTRNV